MKKAEGRPARIESERFTMRSVVPDDVDESYMSWVRDPELPGKIGLNVPPNPTVAQFKRYVQTFDNRNSYHLAIATKQSGVDIGYYWVNVELDNKTAMSHVVISNRDYWGKKVVQETRVALLDFLFFSLGMDKVLGRPLARNFSAIFNYQALGFTKEGVLRAQILEPGGKRVDQVYFGLLREEWIARKKGTAK